MAYKFRRNDKSVTKGVRRIAKEQIDAALAEIADPVMPLPTKIHQLRKHAKKLRGLVRAVRPGFPGYATENAAVRDAARVLSGLRDKGGMLETYDKLMAATGTPPSHFAALRKWLLQGQAQATAQPEMGDALDQFQIAMIEMRARVAYWKVSGRGFAALEPGIAKTWGRARKAMKRFACAPSDEAVHEWRKRVKYHWYHCRILSPTHPRSLARRAHQTRDLSEMLGDHHDITVLERFLETAADVPGDVNLPAFLDLARQRQESLREQALSFGSDLFGDPAKATLPKWSQWWKNWRAA